MCLASAFGHFQEKEMVSLCIMLYMLLSRNLHPEGGVRGVVSRAQTGFMEFHRAPPWTSGSPGMASPLNWKGLQTRGGICSVRVCSLPESMLIELVVKIVPFA